MSYTQSPHLTEEEIKEFLDKAKVARICTLNKDRTIHAAPVWFRIKDEKIVIFTPERSRKARNLKRGSTATLLIDDEGPPTRGVIIYGKADISSENILNTAEWLFEKYMPKGKAKTTAEGLRKIATGIIIAITPGKIASFDYAKDTVYRAAVTYTSEELAN
ncbi:MAG: pyridoxamine 5'-phosphate oxidase family protein [Candidatus Hodarchaeota archaeon]